MSATDPASRRRLIAAACIVVIALLPLFALLLPMPSAGMPVQRLIVLLPGTAATLPQAASLLDAAEARPLGQGAWPNLWLVATSAENAPTRLYRAGAHLVLAGDGLLAGCLGFRSLPPA